MWTIYVCVYVCYGSWMRTVGNNCYLILFNWNDAFSFSRYILYCARLTASCLEWHKSWANFLSYILSQVTQKDYTSINRDSYFDHGLFMSSKIHIRDSCPIGMAFHIETPSWCIIYISAESFRLAHETQMWYSLVFSLKSNWRHSWTSLDPIVETMNSLGLALTNHAY